MSEYIIELNDGNIQISAPGSVLGSSPGFANIAASSPSFGEEAMQQARLHPRHSFNQFWSQLSLDPLTNSNKYFQHQADLAHAHLNRLAEIHQVSGDVIFAVPSHYSQSQLALLLGIANESPFNVVGMVDLAIAHLAQNFFHGQAVFIDVQLHQVVLTTLTQENGMLSRGKILQIPNTGLLALYDAWSNLITDAFIKQSRFDPQHNAETEQYVYSQLSLWLNQAITQNEVLLEINNNGTVHQARLNLSDFQLRTTHILNRISDELNSLVQPNSNLFLPEYISKLPGFSVQFPSIKTLDATALNKNCFDNLQHIKKAPNLLSLITKLPLQNNSQQTDINSQTESLQPTHILYNNTAYSLPPTNLTISSTEQINDKKSANIDYLEINNPALSEPLNFLHREHSLTLQYSSTLPLALNNKPVTQDIKLKLGDVISLKEGSLTLQLIRVP